VSAHQPYRTIVLVLPALVAVAIFVACGDNGASSESASRQFVQAVRAMSGDSLEVFLPERTATAMIGIQAPPANTECGNRARAFVADLVQSGVTLEQTPPLDIDAQGRRLFHAFTLNGQNIALLALREGLVRTVDVSHKYQASFGEAEQFARSAGRGCVWATT
jgi:endonuclease YncB( thermonuclease family)